MRPEPDLFVATWEVLLAAAVVGLVMLAVGFCWGKGSREKTPR